MNNVPANPKIYHITHIDNLQRIIEEGGLWSDREMINQKKFVNPIGLADVKSRRLNKYEVGCHPGTKVGDYVPFYFCARSVMLSVFWYNNLPELKYRGGQEPIVHLQADMKRCVAWAKQDGRRFAFSDMNAGMETAEFFNRRTDLQKLDWEVIGSTNFSGDRRHRKAAEFLMHRFFPWDLVENIGVIDQNRARVVRSVIRTAGHQPPVRVERSWYF